MSANFFEVIHQIATEKGIDRDQIEEIVGSAMLSAYKKQYGVTNNVEIICDREKNKIRILTRKMVVKNPINLSEEISFEEVKTDRPDVNLGDEIEVEEDPLKSFGRIAAQTAKQVIVQKIKEVEKDIVYNEFKDKQGELINGFIQRKVKEAMFIDLGKTEGVIPAREQSQLEHFKVGDRIKALVLVVSKNSKGPSVILSRANPKFVEKLFEMEIPEIYDGVVNIVNIVREAGFRTKVAVTSNRDDVDGVGACVGMKGIRIQAIVRELEGEKIDVVEYSSDKTVFASNALTPARVKEAIETKDGKVIAVVDNDKYRLAIGRGGHNARLSSKLCGFNIDIKTEEEYHEFLSTGDSRALVDELFAEKEMDETPLEELPDLSQRLIKLLEDGGIFSVEDLVERSEEELLKIEGIGQKTAEKIIEIINESVDFDEEDEEIDQDEKNGEEDEDNEENNEYTEEEDKANIEE